MDPNKKSKLIESAIAICAERGIHSTSTGQIAKAAGVAAGTLFTYFATKEELMQAAYVECKTSLGAAMQTGLASLAPSADFADAPDASRGGQGVQTPQGVLSFHDFLASVWTSSLEWGLAAPDRNRFLQHFKQLPESERTTPEIKALLDSEMRFFVGAIDAARERGEMIPIDREYLMFLFGAWFDATLQYLQLQKKKDRPAVVQESFRLLWRAVSA